MYVALKPIFFPLSSILAELRRCVGKERARRLGLSQTRARVWCCLGSLALPALPCLPIPPSSIQAQTLPFSTQTPSLRHAGGFPSSCTDRRENTSPAPKVALETCAWLAVLFR